MAKILIVPEYRTPENRDGIYVGVFIPRVILVEANIKSRESIPNETLLKIFRNSEYDMDVNYG